MSGFVFDGALVADLADDRIQKDHRPYWLQRSSVPFPDLLDHRVGDLGNEVWGNLNVIDLGQVPLNVADRHAVGVETDHDLVDAIQSPLTLTDDLRLVAAVAVPRHLQIEVAGLRQQHLR